MLQAGPSTDRAAQLNSPSGTMPCTMPSTSRTRSGVSGNSRTSRGPARLVHDQREDDADRKDREQPKEAAGDESR